MTAPVIVMIVIGLAFIAASYMLSEKITENKETPSVFIPDISDDLSQEQSEKINQKVEEILDNKAQDYIVKTEDELSKVSNDKIMALHEYSEQVFAKIDNNHNEVVFLYDMLSSKEKELKDTLRELDAVKKELSEKKKSSKNSKNSGKNKAKTDNVLEEFYDDFEEDLTAQSEKKEERKKRSDEEVEAILDMDDYNDFVEQNNNEQILTMYESGKSVIEISRELGIGQGEVKLVINLYKGINRK